MELESEHLADTREDFDFVADTREDFDFESHVYREERIAEDFGPPEEEPPPTMVASPPLLTRDKEKIVEEFSPLLHIDDKFLGDFEAPSYCKVSHEQHDHGRSDVSYKGFMIGPRLNSGSV
jgi:hypothetical protein